MAAEKTLNFLHDYKERRVLWDISFGGYSDRVKRRRAYSELGKKYDLTEKGVKNKIKSLRSYFAKEVTKLKNRRELAEPGENYESSWFAFDAMLFLEDSVNPRSDRVVGAPKPNLVKWDDLGLTSGDNTDEETGPLSSNEEDFVYTPEETGDSSLVSNPPSFLLSKQKTRKRKYEDDLKEENASNSLKNSYINELAIFSHLLRIQLSKLSRLNQVIAKNKINNFLFDLEMDELNHTGESSENFKRDVFSEENSLQSLKSVEDEMLLFAQMIQIQVSRLNRRNQMVARNEITNLVFELEMEELKKSSLPQISSVTTEPSSSPQISYVTIVPSLPPQISSVTTEPSLPPQINSVATLPSLPPKISSVTTLPSLPPKIRSVTTVPSSPPQISSVKTVSSSSPHISFVSTLPSSPPQTASDVTEDPLPEKP